MRHPVLTNKKSSCDVVTKRGPNGAHGRQRKVVWAMGHGADRKRAGELLAGTPASELVCLGRHDCAERPWRPPAALFEKIETKEAGRLSKTRDCCGRHKTT